MAEIAAQKDPIMRQALIVLPSVHDRLQFAEAVKLSAARAEIMARMFLNIFRFEHPLTQIAAAQSVIATIIEENSISAEDAVGAVDDIAADIKDALSRIQPGGRA